MLVEDILNLHENFWKILPKEFFPEIPGKNLHWIWDNTQQISGEKDEYSPTEKNQTVSHTNEASIHHWQWSIKYLLTILWDYSGAKIAAKT